MLLCEWLKWLKDVVYDADDLMDEFFYETMLRREMGSQLKHKILVSMGVTFLYKAVGLHRGRKVIAFVGADRGTNWRVYQVILYALVGVFAGLLGGPHEIGCGLTMGPLSLQVGVPPGVKYTELNLDS